MLLHMALKYENWSFSFLVATRSDYCYIKRIPTALIKVASIKNNSARGSKTKHNSPAIFDTTPTPRKCWWLSLPRLKSPRQIRRLYAKRRILKKQLLELKVCCRQMHRLSMPHLGHDLIFSLIGCVHPIQRTELKMGLALLTLWSFELS